MTTKFKTTLIASMLAISPAFAQKAKVVSAYNYNKAYERDQDCSDLEKGIAAINSATKDEKTKTYTKTWYYGGNLYFNAVVTKDEECKAKFPEAAEKAYDYYVTSMRYNIENGEAKDLNLSNPNDAMKFVSIIKDKNTKYDDASYMTVIMNQKMPYLANAFINNGVEAFQNEEYEKAKKLSMKSAEVNSLMGRFDSLGLYNAALAAERLEDYDAALKIYDQLAEVNYGGSEIYLYMASIYNRKKDTTNKIKAIKRGLEAYPDDANLIKEELNYLLITGKTDEALANFDKAIANDPENPSLYYNRGLIYDGLSKNDESAIEKAAADYNKAVEVDPEFFDAAYNLGALYYNTGAEWNNKASSYGLKEQAKYNAADKKAKGYFAKARPALEKAHKINPEDIPTIASLVKIYAIAGEDQLYSDMKAKLDKLQGK